MNSAPDILSDLTNISPGSPYYHVILDCARDKSIYPTLKASGESFSCMFNGELPEELRAVSPHLVRLTDNELSRWITTNCWNKSWGIFIASSIPTPSVRLHFRKISKASASGGQKLFFRYFDPRVLRVFLPTCSPFQLKQIIGDLDCIYLEDGKTADPIVFYLKKNKHRLDLSSLK